MTGHRTWHQLWGNFLNIQNYVGGIAHTWTLALEEHAYLLLLFLIAFFASRRARVRIVFLTVASLAALSVTWSFVLASHLVGVQERTDTRVGGILYGLLLAMLYHYAPQSFRRLQMLWPLWLSILIGSLLYLRFQVAAWWDPPLQFLLMDLCGVSLLLLLYRHNEAQPRSHHWLYRAVAWIGLYSYGIYLWHVALVAPIEAFSHHLTPRMGAAALNVLPIFAAVVLGFLATKLIEFPTLALRDRYFPRRVDSAVGEPAVLEARSVHGPVP